MRCFYANTGEYDDTIMDIMMPKLDGLQAPTRLRAMLRRTGDYKPGALRFGDLELDCGNSALRCKERAEWAPLPPSVPDGVIRFVVMLRE